MRARAVTLEPAPLREAHIVAHHQVAASPGAGGGCLGCTRAKAGIGLGGACVPVRLPSGRLPMGSG